MLQSTWNGDKGQSVDKVEGVI
jgi:hypothetical protein